MRPCSYYNVASSYFEFPKNIWFFLFALLFLFRLLSPDNSHAESTVLRYTDKNGREHFVTSEKDIPALYRDQLKNQKALPKLSSYEFYGGREPVNKPLASPKVKVFVTSWCQYCEALERFLTMQKIPYVSYDIERNQKANAIYKSFGVRGVPVTQVGDQVISGYNPQAVFKAFRASQRR